MKLYMGIDIAKRSHTDVVLNAKGEVVVKALAFDNNRAGIEQLLMCLAGFELPVEIALNPPDITGWQSTSNSPRLAIGCMC